MGLAHDERTRGLSRQPRRRNIDGLAVDTADRPTIKAVRKAPGDRAGAPRIGYRSTEAWAARRARPINGFGGARHLCSGVPDDAADGQCDQHRGEWDDGVSCGCGGHEHGECDGDDGAESRGSSQQSNARRGGE